MNLPIPASAAPNHALTLRREGSSSPIAISASRPKFLPTHWPLPEVRVRRPALLAGPVDEPARSRWPAVALKILAVALCYALVRDVEAAEPLSLRYGEPQVLSALGEPVDIRIPITSKDVNPDARFILGTQDATAGLPTLRHANIRLERDARGWALRIQSNRRSTDPAMNLVVQEVIGGGVVSRTLPVLFDPSPAQAPVILQAAAEPETEPAQTLARRESWWTSAVAMKPSTATPATLTARNPDEGRPQAQPSPLPTRVVSRTSESARKSTSRKSDLAMQTAPQRPALASARRSPPNVRQDLPSRLDGTALRMTVALDLSPRLQAVAAQPADRDTLRWLQRGMLGADERLAVQALSRKVMQLNAQLENLELQISAANAARSGSPAGSVPAAPVKTQEPTGNGALALHQTGPAHSSPALKISALMSEPAKPGNNTPWGLPLMAGLMLGAGYWSGRKGRH